MAYRLFVDGNDRIGAVTLSSIEVVEACAGQVSSMTFTIEDIAAAIIPLKYSEIIFDAGSSTTRLFFGYLTTVTYKPFGLGRMIECQATGVEILLDWLNVPSAFGVSTGLLTAQLIANGVQAVTSTITVLDPFANETTDAAIVAGSTRNGNGTRTVGTLLNTATTPDEVARTAFDTSDDPMTLRDWIMDLAAHSAFSDYPSPVVIQRNSVPLFVTIDFNLQLRVWENGTALQPDDWTTLTVLDTTAGAIVASDPELTIDWGDVIDRVYVMSTTAAGEGFEGSASVPGHWTIVNDDLSTTSAKRAVVAENVMDGHSETVAGKITIENFTPATTVHAGGLLDFIDAGISANGTFRISEIRKSNFRGNGKQDWEIRYGGMPRRITRRTAVRFRRVEF